MNRFQKQLIVNGKPLAHRCGYIAQQERKVSAEEFIRDMTTEARNIHRHN